MIRRSAFIICLLFSGATLAWEPCKPFCDNACSGPAIVNYASVFVNGLGRLASASAELSTQRTDTAVSWQELALSIGTNEIEQMAQLLSALDATMNIIELNSTKNAVTVTRGVDLIANTVNGKLRELAKQEAISTNAREFNPSNTVAPLILGDATGPENTISAISESIASHSMNVSTSLQQYKALSALSNDYANQINQRIADNERINNLPATLHASAAISTTQIADTAFLLINESSPLLNAIKAIALSDTLHANINVNAEEVRARVAVIPYLIEYANSVLLNTDELARTSSQSYTHLSYTHVMQRQHALASYFQLYVKNEQLNLITSLEALSSL